MIEVSEIPVKQFEADTLPGRSYNSHLCWVCGKYGTEYLDANLLICHRHPEGDVRWSIIARSPKRLKEVVAVNSTDHTLVNHGHP